MKKKLRGIKRRDFLYDFDLYRRRVPIPGISGAALSVVDLHPEGATEAILFVHGYAGILESWEYQINHFVRAAYRVVAPDLRGHGQSDAPYSAYTMPELVADLHAVVETLGLPERFVLVGHSFGGSLCVEYAHAHPERLSKLVLIAAAGEFPLPRIADWLLRIPLGLIRPLWRYRNRWDAELHVVKRLMANNMRHWSGWNKMRAIETPTLVVTGERDNYFPRWIYDDVGKTIPGAEIYDVGSAKHKVQLERHQAVNRAIERFVGGRATYSWREGRGAGNGSDRVWTREYNPATPASIPIPERRLPDVLRHTAEWLPKKTATIFFGARLTYQQLYGQVNQFAHVLLGSGVKPRDRVMIILPNMPQFIIAYYATLTIGGVVVLSNPDADADRIVQQARETGARVLVTLNGFRHLAQRIKNETDVVNVFFADLTNVVSRSVYRQLIARWKIAPTDDVTWDEAPVLERTMTALIADMPLLDPPQVSFRARELATIAYTSGTTEDPKGVCLSHSNLVANALQTRHWFPEMRFGAERFLNVIPLVHSYGLTSTMNVPILVGATMILLPLFDVHLVLEHIKSYRPTIMPGVPSMYVAINQAPNVRDYGLASITACLSGAAPLPVEVQEAFEKLTQGRLVEGYGLTEATTVTHANPLAGARRSGSIGVPISNTDARITDLLSGAVVGPGEIGELEVRGPQVMMGYWQGDGVLDRGAISAEGWLRTGDVAAYDRDGYFQIVSRKQDTIVFGDFNVYPRDVEEVLYENNKVLEVAVIGVGTVDGSTRIKAFVVPRPGSNLTAEELLELCRRRLEPYAVPWEIEFRETLPKSFIGKVLRRLLEEGA